MKNITLKSIYKLIKKNKKNGFMKNFNQLLNYLLNEFNNLILYLVF